MNFTANLKIFIILLVVLLIIAGCSSKKKQEATEQNNVEQMEIAEESIEPELNDSDIEETLDEEQVVEEETIEEDNLIVWTEKYGIEIGKEYVINGETGIYLHPERLALQNQLDSTHRGERYLIEDIQGPLAKIKARDKSGWASVWYFTDEAKDIRFGDPHELIVLQPVTFSYYPNEEDPYGFELATGKVVQVIKRYNDWVSVRAIIHDPGYPGDIWIKRDHLIAYDENMASEGILVLGSKVYDEAGRVKEDKSGFPVTITGEQGDKYKFEAAGGKTGYIFKEDFVPNPFIRPILTMRFAVNFGMEADYLVDKLTAHRVTVRYFDYQHFFEPEEEARTVPFDEMMQSIEGIREHFIDLYLSYSYQHVKLNPTNTLIDLIETEPSFRENLGKILFKEFDGIGHELNITVDMLNF